MNTTNYIQLENGQILELSDNTVFPINFSVGDIRDISAKKGTFSKSINLPGTKNNNLVLGNLYDVNIYNATFNINTITNCSVIQNGITILTDLSLQLINVNKSQDTIQYEDGVEYIMLVKDKLGDFFTAIGEKELTDLSGFDKRIGTLTDTLVSNSWNNTYLDGYKFIIPMGYDIPTMSYLITQFKPGIYVKNIFDKIFGENGYSYKWDEQFDSNVQFHKLIMPYNGGEVKTSEESLTASTINVLTTNSVSYSSRTFDQILYLNTTGEKENQPSNIISLPITNSDPSGLWNGTTYTTPNIDSVNNKISATFEIDYVLEVRNNSGGNAWMESFIYSPSINNLVNDDMSITSNFVLNQNGIGVDTTPIVSHIIKEHTQFSAGTTQLSAGTKSITIDTTNVAPNSKITFSELLVINNSKNSKLIFQNFYGTASPQPNTTPLTNVVVVMRITGIRMVMETLKDCEYSYGYNINLQDFIPDKIKQKDFIKSIATMYNLYFVTDKDNPFQINIKTRDKFYDTGEQKDWTHKIDKKINQELRFLPELSNKKFRLKYKDDTDFPNTDYLKLVGESYGEITYTFDNEYIKGEDIKEIIFSPTPCINTDFGAVVPFIDGSAPSINLRVLIDGGMYPSQSWKIQNFELSGGTDSIPSGVTGTASAEYQSYPYFGHWNKPVNPDLDINFGICDFYFRTDSFGTKTNSTLFNLWWRRTLNQINTGKMLIANFILNETDIQQLSLNDKIRIDNSWWNINKIIDYDVNNIKATKVELISIDEELNIPFLDRPVTLVDESTPIIRKGRWLNLEYTWIRNTPWGRVPKPSTDGGFTNLGTIKIPLDIGGIRNTVIQPQNPTNRGKITIWGNDNIVGTTGLVLGHNNAVLTGSDNVVFGNGNVVTDPNVRRAWIFGNGISATTNDTLYTNNINISSGGTLTIGDTILNEDIMTMANASLSTGLYEFTNGGIVIGTGNTINIGGVKGYIVNPLDVLNVNPTVVNYSGVTGITTPYLLTAPASFFLIDSGSTLVIQSIRPTITDRRNMIYLGAIGHPNGFLTGAGNAPDIIMNELMQVRAMFEPTRLINDGVLAYPFSTNMQLANTNGLLYGFGIGFIANGNNRPSILSIPAGAPTTFQYRTNTGQTFANTTTISANTYDLNGVATPIGGATNRATNQRIYLIQNGAIRIQFGQQIYSTLADAIANAQTEPFIVNINAINFGILIGILSVRRSATNLSDVGDARFLQVSKFGESVGAAGGIATGTLQSAYNNSIEPEILTNSTLDGLTIKRGSASDSDALLNLQNGAGVTLAGINGNGQISGVTFVKSGGTSAQFLKADGSVSTLSSISGITGSGTTGYVPKFTASGNVTNSIIYENSSNILIGTTGNTGEKLQVNGSMISTNHIINGQADGGNTYLLFKNAGNFISIFGADSAIFGGSSADVTTYIYDFNKYFIATNGAKRLTVDGAGNVGINETNPINKLNVNGVILVNGDATLPTNTNTGLNIAYTYPISRLFFGDGTGYSLAFSKRNASTTTDLVTVLDSGNVGIGITTPQAKLDVENGNSINTVTSYFTRGAHDGGFRLGFRNGSGSTTNSEQAALTFDYAGTRIGSVGFHRGGSSDCDAITFSTNANNERMRIDSTGNVGIGLTSIGAKLDVNGAIMTRDVFRAYSTSNSFTHYINPSVSEWSTGLDVSNNNYVFATTNGFGTPKVSITQGGNVGINTTTPSQKLHIQDGNIRLDYTNVNTEQGKILFRNASGAKTWSWRTGIPGITQEGFGITNETDTTYPFFIDNSGNIGIGTVTPSQKLEVNGGILATNGNITNNHINYDFLKTFSYNAGGWARNLIRLDNTLMATTNGFNIGMLGTSSDYVYSYLGFGDFNSTNNIVLNKDGNVGIGTVTPFTKLQVTNTSAGTLADNITLVNNSSTAGSEVGMFFAPTTAGSNIRGARISAVNDGSNAIDLKFYTGLGASITEKLRITSTGNVGIGTTNPQSKLTINEAIGGDATYKGAIVINSGFGEANLNFNNGLEFKSDPANLGYGKRILTAFDGLDDYDLYVQTRKNSASWTSQFIVKGTGNVGIGTTTPTTKLSFGGFVSTTNGSVDTLALYESGNNKYGLSVNTNGFLDISANQAPAGGGIRFFGGSDNTSPTERMRIVNNGNVLIGTTTDTGEKLQVNGVIKGISGLFNPTNTTGAFVIRSARSLDSSSVFAVRNIANTQTVNINGSGDIAANSLFVGTDITSDRLFASNGIQWGNSLYYTDTDYDNMLLGGVYEVPTSITNSPPLSGNYTVLVEETLTNEFTQTATHLETNRKFTRNYYSGVWTSWGEIVIGGAFTGSITSTPATIVTVPLNGRIAFEFGLISINGSESCYETYTIAVNGSDAAISRRGDIANVNPTGALTATVTVSISGINLIITANINSGTATFKAKIVGF